MPAAVFYLNGEIKHHCQKFLMGRCLKRKSENLPRKIVSFSFREIKVMSLKIISTLILSAILFVGCLSGNQKQSASKDHSELADSIYAPKYANRFKISYFKNHKVIEVLHPWDSAAPSLKTVLATDSLYLKSNPSAIMLPVKKWVSVASTQIGYANKINVLEQLVGVAEPEYISNPNVIEGLENGSVRNIGTAFAPDIELLLALNPDIMMVSPFKDDFYGPIRSAGIKLTTNCSYLENTPLGRVEWLVYVSAFFNKEKEAIKIVDDISKRYNQVKDIAQKSSDRPSVISGKTYQGIWYVPAAESYNANFYKDAAVDYVFDDRHGTGSLNYDFETVYEAAGECDYWSMLVNYPGEFSYTALKEMDVRYSDFKAFKRRSIIYSNSAYSLIYEKGLLEPDVILADLVKLFHPNLLDGYNTVYYKKLIKE